MHLPLEPSPAQLAESERRAKRRFAADPVPHTAHAPLYDDDSRDDEPVDEDERRDACRLSFRG